MKTCGTCPLLGPCDDRGYGQCRAPIPISVGMIAPEWMSRDTDASHCPCYQEPVSVPTPLDIGGIFTPGWYVVAPAHDPAAEAELDSYITAQTKTAKKDPP